MNDVITFNVQEDSDDTPAEVLSSLIKMGHLPQFVDALVERRDVWTVLCWLEADMLEFERQNRYCGATDGWRLVVGQSMFLLEDVPEYTGYGKVQAWLEYGDSVITIVPPDIRQREDTDDVLIWDAQTFDGVPTASVAFSDSSGIKLNQAMREIAMLENIPTMGE